MRSAVKEKYYHEEVESMFIIGLHPDNGDSWFEHRVEDMGRDVEALMAHQRSLAQARGVVNMYSM